jgi:hypothetical protein
MIEKWKDIFDYSDYKVSNLGNIKSLKFNKELILKSRKNSNGYLYVNLCKEGTYKTIMVHKLVAIGFLNHTPDGTQKIVVDHLDANKENNNLNNLQLISQRENSIKNKLNKTGYTGVYNSSNNKRWVSRIMIGKHTKYLGTFETKTEAHQEYLRAFFNIIKN